MILNKFKTLTLNFGPQHPAAHGVLRLILQISGELVQKADPHIGLLHRGTEKLIEYKTFLQALPYFDRSDYVSSIAQEHVFCKSLETFLQIDIKKKVSYIRVLFLELSRILNHLLALTTHALDVGAMTPFLWGFEDREKIMEIVERLTGARMHAAFIRPGTISVDIYEELLFDIEKFIVKFFTRLDSLEVLLLDSRIWKERLAFIGVITKKLALNYSFSGPMLRACGYRWDLRKVENYEIYNLLNFFIPVGFNGDCYDRFLVRLEEMRQSAFIVNQCLSWLKVKLTLFSSDDIKSDDYTINLPYKNLIKNSMEALISHFKLFTEGFSLEAEDNYTSAETPKGEFGVYLETNNANTAYRCKIRSPGFFHLQALDYMTRNHLIADVVTIIGTQDIVSGEIDRQKSIDIIKFFLFF
jgi:NADH dehydrogenase I D subunit